MSSYASLFLKQFNPCADRVESIEKSIREELDQHTLNELAGHIEKCKRCRRYHGFMESVEKGFREHEVASSEIGPIGLSKLPSKLQDEMSEAMKRNLSKWMFELGRGIMYKQGMITPLFLDLSEQFPFNDTITTSTKILKSLQKMDLSSHGDQANLSGSYLLLKSLKYNSYDNLNDNLIQLFEHCLNIDTDNIKIYYYLPELYVINGNIKQSINITKTVLNNNISIFRKSTLLNNLGRFNYLLDNINKSIELYNDALSLYNNPIIYLNLGLVYLKLNKPEMTYDNYKKSFHNIDDFNPSIKREGLYRYCLKYINYNYKKHTHLISSCDDLKNLLLTIGIE